ncbi:MAG: histidine--tRNA ligase [Candidatus Hydrogenedentes bacterium]|nr:histidine--tRNA ligase [Candidatus Hydrogenedentota bacterium]
MKKKRVRPQTLKGFQDNLPEEMIARQGVIDAIRGVYERFGFVPIDTPILEHFATLTGSAGAEVNKEIFTLETPEGEVAAMRFDLTVPFARVVSQYREQIKLPFRRYHIGPVFRADKPGPGRFRQFTQLDIDVAGARSLAADAEIIAVLCGGMRAAGMTDNDVPLFRIRISNRRLVDALLTGNDITEPERIKHTLRVIDKLQKVGIENVKMELASGRIDASGDPIPGVHLPDSVITAIAEFIAITGVDRLEVVKLLMEKLPASENTEEALADMRELAALLDALGISEAEAVFDPSLTRGLDYYTGPVFEVEVVGMKALGSLGGGGRYNELCNRFMGQQVPAVGASIGLERLMAALRGLEKIKFPRSTVKVCIATVGKVAARDVLKLAAELRGAGLNTLTYLGGKKNMAAQLSDADRYEVPVAVILGEEELQRGEVAVKDLIAGKRSRENIDDHDAYREAGRNAQVTVKREDMIGIVKSLLNNEPVPAQSE